MKFLFQKDRPVQTKYIYFEGLESSNAARNKAEEVEATKEQFRKEQNELRDEIQAGLPNKESDLIKSTHTWRQGDSLEAVAYGFDRQASALWQGRKGNEGKVIDHSDKVINVPKNAEVVLKDGSGEVIATAKINSAKGDTLESQITEGAHVSFEATGEGNTVRMVIENGKTETAEAPTEELALKESAKLEEALQVLQKGVTLESENMEALAVTAQKILQKVLNENTEGGYFQTKAGDIWALHGKAGEKVSFFMQEGGTVGIAVDNEAGKKFYFSAEEFYKSLDDIVNEPETPMEQEPEAEKITGTEHPNKVLELLNKTDSYQVGSEVNKAAYQALGSQLQKDLSVPFAYKHADGGVDFVEGRDAGGEIHQAFFLSTEEGVRFGIGETAYETYEAMLGELKKDMTEVDEEPKAEGLDGTEHPDVALNFLNEGGYSARSEQNKKAYQSLETKLEQDLPGLNFEYKENGGIGSVVAKDESGKSYSAYIVNTEEGVVFSTGEDVHEDYQSLLDAFKDEGVGAEEEKEGDRKESADIPADSLNVAGTEISGLEHIADHLRGSAIDGFNGMGELFQEYGVVSVKVLERESSRRVQQVGDFELTLVSGETKNVSVKIWMEDMGALLHKEFKKALDPGYAKEVERGDKMAELVNQAVQNADDIGVPLADGEGMEFLFKKAEAYLEAGEGVGSEKAFRDWMRSLSEGVMNVYSYDGEELDLSVIAQNLQKNGDITKENWENIQKIFDMDALTEKRAGLVQERKEIDEAVAKLTGTIDVPGTNGLSVSPETEALWKDLQAEAAITVEYKGGRSGVYLTDTKTGAMLQIPGNAISFQLATAERIQNFLEDVQEKRSSGAGDDANSSPREGAGARGPNGEEGRSGTPGDIVLEQGVQVLLEADFQEIPREKMSAMLKNVAEGDFTDPEERKDAVNLAMMSYRRVLRENYGANKFPNQVYLEPIFEGGKPKIKIKSEYEGGGKYGREEVRDFPTNYDAFKTVVDDMFEREKKRK